MSWITILWSMNAAACLTLAGIYLLVWCKQRESWVYLAFSFSAVGGAALTAFELALVRAQTVEEYGAILRWAQLPIWLVVVSLVIFVRLYLRAGRPWLAWSVCGLRTLALILNFVFVPNLSYRQITHLNQVSWWGGETVSVPMGVTNPWVLVAQLSLLLLIVFFIDATITVWRRHWKRGLVVGSALILFSLIAVGQVVLVVWGIITIPFLAAFPFLGLLAAMAYELSSDMLRAGQLARELKASEAARRNTERGMELAVNAAGIVAWTWDIPRDEVWLSDKDRALLGFSKDESLSAESVRRVIHPEDREFVRNTVKRSLETRDEIEAEYRVVLPGGKVRWMTRRAHIEFDDKGKPVWERGVLIDVTERKLAEERFRLVVDAAPSGMVMANREGKIILVNAQVETFFGYTRDELIGQPIEMLVPERFRSQHTGFRGGYLGDARARAMGAGRELFARRKDGSEFPVEIGLNPIHTPEGLSILASIVDISERKRAELEQARQRDELAHLSRVTMLGELCGSLAHELNQPLTAVLSNAQAAQRFLGGEHVDLAEIGEILQDIVAENKRAGEVIQRLRLLLKKGEAQHRDCLNINDVVQSVLKLTHNNLQNNDITVDTELAPNLPTVAGDRVQLQQVLLNLVLNACEAMENCEPSERRLRVVTKLDNGAVRVSVSDPGGSIPEEKIESVFHPFFTTKAEGMGLGLSICRTIISAHRGKIWATNNLDCGATFHFELPVTKTS
jgi:PAS domain S-box-containing protein